MSVAIAEDFAGIVSQRVAAERHALAARWLQRLTDILTVQPNEVFPSAQLLDHIPTLIAEIAAYLRAPADEEIAANTLVIEKARELGTLRHQQQASVHQLLREYEILADILETFVAEETERLGLRPSPLECFELLRRLTRSSRIVMRATIDTFVGVYMTAIHERNERIKAFNQMASHELRSPLGTLLFAAAALDREDIRVDATRFPRIVSTIKSNLGRMTSLLDNLQRVSRLSDDIDGPNEQRIEVTTVALEVARQLEEMAASHRVRITVDADLPVVAGDPARLELALMNLVSNAIKYSDPKKAECLVEIAPAARDGVPEGFCVIGVRDNGLGIDAADQPAIFDRFFRAHAHRDAELGVTGSGLGLAIAADCVRALGGTIDCESAVGEGSCFLITVPINRPHATAPD